MAAVRFTCVTESKALHEEIRNLTFLAGGAILRERVKKDSAKGWLAEYEIVSEGGTLYRQVKELKLATTITLIG